jgi:hypothetical protein
MFPFQMPKKPEVEPEPINEESSELKGLLNLNDWCFRGIFFALGVTGANLVRFKSEYVGLLIVAAIVSTLWLLFVPPRNIDSQFLYRSAGFALICGIAFVFWELLPRVNPIHLVAAAFVIAGIVALMGMGE